MGSLEYDFYQVYRLEVANQRANFAPLSDRVYAISKRCNQYQTDLLLGDISQTGWLGVVKPVLAEADLKFRHGMVNAESVELERIMALCWHYPGTSSDENMATLHEIQRGLVVYRPECPDILSPICAQDGSRRDSDVLYEFGLSGVSEIDLTPRQHALGWNLRRELGQLLSGI